MMFVVVQMLIVARIIGHFGATASKTLALSVVIPGLIYICDALGTHADSIVMRGLSLSLSIQLKLRREICIGLLISLMAVATAYVELVLGGFDSAFALTPAPSLLVPVLAPRAGQIALMPSLFRANQTLSTGLQTTLKPGNSATGYSCFFTKAIPGQWRWHSQKRLQSILHQKHLPMFFNAT